MISNSFFKPKQPKSVDPLKSIADFGVNTPLEIFDVSDIVAYPYEKERSVIIDELVKSLDPVTPAKAGVQKYSKVLDSGSSPE